MAEVAESLIKVECKVDRPSLDAPPPAKKRVASVRSDPPQDVRSDKVNHLPDYTDKRQRCRKCKTGFSYLKCNKCNV